MGRRSLTNRRILLTGASSGVGLSLARALAAHRTSLLLVARRSALLKELASTLPALGAATADVLVGDVTDPAIREEAVKRICDKWGGLDVLINNAGVSAHGRFANSDAATLRRIMEVNFFAVAELTRLSIPLLREGEDPLVVNVGSILSHRALPHNNEYCASKFALRGWSEAIRPELRREGIDLLMVSPGTIDTDFFEHLVAKKSDVPWGTQKAISAEAVSQQIVRAMIRRKSEIFPNWRGRVLGWLNRACPRLVDTFLNRFG